MRQTNKYMRGGTAIIIAAGLGLSSTALSSDSEPIKQAVKTALEHTDAPINMAEATNPKINSQSTVITGLVPMQLRMKPEFTPAQISKIEMQRQAYVKGDKGSVGALNSSMANLNRNNRFQVTISDNGDGFVEISKGRGGWPGFPKSNTDWEKRVLSPDMERGLKVIMERCAEYDKPIYFMATLNDGDADIGKGDFEVGCTPKVASQRNKFTYTDYAQAYLNSDDLPLEQRQRMANLTANFGMLSEYVKTTPHATIAQDRLECVKIHEKTKKEYGFTQDLRDGSDRFLAKCATTNYNWIRKREKIPLIQ